MRGIATRRLLAFALALVPIALCAFCFTSGASFFSTHTSPLADSVAASSLEPFWSDSDFSTPSRASIESPVYPYSVIPGGVLSAKALEIALRHDPVAAAHYADFHVKSARLIRLARERKAHVSYRLGNQIFWTREEVTLHAGEALLSDGMNLVRTRCGNRIAAVPDGPIAPMEPPVDVIDGPVVPALPPHPPAISTDSIPAAPIWRESAPPLLLAFDLPAKPITPGTVPFPSVPPFAPCCGGSPTPSTSSQPTPQPLPLPVPVLPPPSPGPSSGTLPQPISPSTPAPTPTPEPSTMVQLILGFAGIALFLKFRRS
ncbi:MAG: hypothetical protein WAK48_07495 [Candidatus Acidiferrum sp.]